MPKRSSQTANGPAPAKTGDSRFANFESDPRFRLPSKKATKTTIDKRFSRLLKDEEFIKSAKVDRYGRKLEGDNKKKALKNLYEAEDEEDESEEDDGVVRKELQKADTKYDPARGGGFSSSESDSESEDEENEDEGGGGAEVEASGSMQRIRDAQADVETGEISKRIAIVNLDWDHIKSEDLMALFSSFVPKGGRIERISIFPSEFGKERMQREELEGPPKEIFKKDSIATDEDSEEDFDVSDEDDEDEDENIKNDLIQEGDDQEFNQNSLRSYQIDRLKYYYAVMVCSDEATAEELYKATDGTEYQTSSNFLDLRFCPDDVVFDDEPRDSCDSIPADYKPKEFVTEALQHSKVKLTWDIHPDDASRRENIKRAFGGSRSEIQENDLKAYLASDSEDEDDQQGNDDVADGEPKLTKKELARQRMREALGLGIESASKSSKSAPVGEIEVTFALDDEDGDKGEQIPADVEETTVEKYMRKEREKKARKKEKAVAKRDGVEGTEPDEEGPADQAEDEDLGFNDPFFTTDEPATVSKSAQRKEERLKKRELKEAEAKQKAAQKAQLELLMADDSQDAIGHLGHFDIKEITRMEKQKFKKSKKKQKAITDRGGLQEGFELDAGDRFKAAFESHEYAIDPSNPNFKATPGMKQLLEESRKKRSHGDETSSRSKKKVRRGQI
ncbi:hypothetical protein BJ170DRAFT_250522 [Xylariales sp. AK1849]|nr:hypothetical protein BJ170DRAFT_250522 [Xylariales sp. AK1849]